MMRQEPLTDEQMAALRQEVARRLEAMATGFCPQCGAKVEQEEQIGRCVYGRPCGCRMWVGKARKKDK